jgi:hypothetical protein
MGYSALKARQTWDYFGGLLAFSKMRLKYMQLCLNQIWLCSEAMSVAIYGDMSLIE